jgi:RNA 2',3'-cyclic 3'-phosphodiesterase
MSKDHRSPDEFDARPAQRAAGERSSSSAPDVSARREGRAVRFFAWEPSEAAKAALGALAHELRARPDGAAVRWVRRESYHVTLRFLGNVASELVPELVAAVQRELAGTPAFDVAFGPPHAFPSAREPRVVVVAALPEAPLAALAARLEAAVVAAGLPAETRRFRAHLTLGRVRSRRLPPLDAPAPGAAARAVREVVLFRSDLGRDGSRYTPLARLPLASAAALADPLPLPTSIP